MANGHFVHGQSVVIAGDPSRPLRFFRYLSGGRSAWCIQHKADYHDELVCVDVALLRHSTREAAGLPKWAR